MVKPSTTKREEVAMRNQPQTPIKIPWPNLKKKYKLKTQTVIPSQILRISNLFSSDECKEFIRSLDNHKSGVGSCVRFETTNRIPKRGEAFRLNDRISVYDPYFAQLLWSQTGLKTIFERWLTDSPASHDNEDDIILKKKCWGLNPNIRIYRYQVGHKFEKHYDDSVKISTLDPPDFRECLAPSNPNNNANTTQDFPNVLSTEYTLLIYLNGSEGCDQDSEEKATPVGQSVNKSTSSSDVLRGGETVFYSNHSQTATPCSKTKKRLINLDKKSKESPQNKQQRDDQSIVASIDPIAGLALIHRHGSKCLLHEGREVTSGVKYVLRSDIMFG